METDNHIEVNESSIIKDNGKLQDTPHIPEELPILPLRDIVLYPFSILPMAMDTGLTQAVDEAMSKDRIVGILTVKDNEKETITWEDLFSIGSAATIHKMMKMPDGSMRLIVQGLTKIKVVDQIQSEPFFKASIEVLKEEAELTTNIEALMRTLVNQYQKLTGMVPYIPDELQMVAMNIDEPLKLTYFIATIVKMKTEERQEILELDNVEEKLRKVSSLLQREIELLELGGKIQSQVKSEMGKSQREYFLREQLKAIQQELGELDEKQSEIKEMRERIETANLPENVNKEAQKELSRFEKLSPASAEYGVIRTYLEWLIELPWNKSSEDNLDLARAKEILDEDHYDLKDVKDRIIELLAVRKLKQDMKGPILCFVGPPGVGKTSLGHSIARALGRNFMRMSLGGVRDEAEIRGHRRTYVGALPGRIIQFLRRAETNNPVFMLDEVDKVGADFRGDPSSALLEVLDPEQNVEFFDHYLDLPFDLSKVLFITTANVIETIQPALRDRMEILKLPGYTEEEKTGIALQYLIPKQIKEHGISPEHITLNEDVIKKIINSYTREAGVRNLERQIARICRKVARKVALKEIESDVITTDNIKDYLGPEMIFPEVARRVSTPGVTTGLAWTEQGGDILFVEALKMKGEKGFVLTGQLGDVMKESANAALSYIRSVAKDLEIDEEFFKKYDIHVHVPAGAIPKDGPSAGTAIATSIASIMTGKAVRNDVAMTGEITLSGIVLPIGGVKEKVLAAKRAGIKTVILPKRNENDLEELEDNIKEGLTFELVERIEQVFGIAFENQKHKNTIHKQDT
ncbi:MAG: endopeptidase La [Thermodesulfobacteriota bacterium]|nr:endopeptidase La [Thermodesulfobacteriota bacterium]